MKKIKLALGVILLYSTFAMPASAFAATDSIATVKSSQALTISFGSIGSFFSALFSFDNSKNSNNAGTPAKNPDSSGSTGSTTLPKNDDILSKLLGSIFGSKNNDDPFDGRYQESSDIWKKWFCY